MIKRILTLVLSISLVSALLPTSAFAAAAEPGEATAAEAYNYADAVENGYKETKTNTSKADTDTGGILAEDEMKVEDDLFGGIQSLALPTNNKQTVRWTYGNNVYTEFYVTAYDQDTEKELSFDIDYSVTATATEVTIDLSELTDSVTHISDGTNAYDYTYATVYGIDYSDENNKADESYWQTLGSKEQPVTKLVLTYGDSISGSRLWGYSVYSGDDELGHIDVLAHNDSQHPYIYLQLWCTEEEMLTNANRQTARWTYGNNVYTEFYVTAYDQDTKNELSFDLDYNKEETASDVTVDLEDFMSNVSNINDGTYAYDYEYATVCGIDYSEESHRSNASYWQTLGSVIQPVTSLKLIYGNSVSGSRLWGYSVYSEDTELGHIDVLAHDDSAHPYIYLQLWCSQGDELPDIAKNINTDVVYKQLDTAISEASEGDTIQLLADLDVDVKKADQYTIDKDLTLDLNENTITVDCSNDSYRLFNVASGVEATIENGTIDGDVDSNASGNAIYGNGTSSALTDVILEDLTIENFGSSSNYGTVYVYDGSLTATDCTFLNNGNSAITMRSSAGDANLYDGTALTLDDCLISGNTNSTNNYGGGVGVRQISEVSISDCTFKGNTFKSTPSGIYGGGGLILYNVGEITLDGNTITKNESSEYGGGVLILSGSAFSLGDKTTISNNTITENTAWSNGGGLSYYINTETHTEEAYCTFTGNTIDNNYSYTRGGGMSMYSNDTEFTFTIYSGTVNNNKANDSGGGIDYAWERPATLQLYSALITENIAAKGGGVWLCPTSETIMHVTFGGAIYNNKASESVEETEPCGDEIRFEGDSYGDGYDGMMVNIASRALGGTLMDWYTDEYGARYNDGLGTLIDVTSPEYTDRTEEFSVHGELSESGIALAEEDATTIISRNEAEQGYGGGIASNAVIEFGEEDTEVTVVKEWKDENGEDIIEDLPDSIEVTLVRVSGDGEEAERVDLETVTLSEENDWTWTFTELPSNYTYEVREETKLPGYETSYDITTDDDGIKHIVITNTLEVVNIGGVKIWNDADNQDGKRPGIITIYLKADGEYVTDENGEPITATIYYQVERTAISPVAEPLFKLMSADLSQWNWEFVDENGNPIALPKYDESDGHEIEYTVEEVDIDGYTTKITGDAESGFEITNIHIPETIDINGEKVWDDDNNRDDIRPSSITLFLYAGNEQVIDDYGQPVSVTVTPDEDGNWSWSFTDLPKYSEGEEIHYSVKEDYEATGYEASYGLDDEGNIIITNSHEPETVDISFTKNWDDNNNQDNEEPYSITVRLRKAGQAEEIAHVTLTAEDNWSYTWTGLPKYENGEEIWYYVTEDAIEGYTPSYDPESSMENGYTITNTHTPDLTSVAVSKVWLDEEDQDGKRPENINVTLLADGSPVLDENEAPVTLELSADNNWFGTFSDLPVYREGAVGEKIEYTVQESGLPDGYEKTITGDATTGYVITNSYTPETTSISGTKVWDDKDNQDGKRPDSITITLWADNALIDEIEVTADDDWSWSFAGLPKYVDGKEITYHIHESALDNYSTEYVEDSYDIINSYTPEQTSVTVTKVWNDAENQDGNRPNSVEVQLLADGEPVTEGLFGAKKVTVTLDDSNNWQDSFTELDKYADGKEIVYTVEEVDPDDELGAYTTEITGDAEIGFVITNTALEEFSIGKEVAGNGETTDYEFEVTLTKDGVPYAGDVETKDGETVTFEDGKATITVTAGEKVTLEVPYGTTWEIVEITDDADSVVIYVDGNAVKKSDTTEAHAAVGTIWDSTEVVFVNSYREYFPIDEEIVTDEDDIFNTDAWVKDESVNEYNAIEIEMTTTLPVITTYDIENGEFTMNFHEVLDHELVLDEDAADFTVYIARHAISPMYYTVTFDEETGDDCNFHVDVDLTALYNDGVITEDDLQGDTEITIFFFADLEGTDLNGSYKSTIWYDIYDADELLYTSNVDVVEVYTYEIEIFKYDSETSEGLAGATLGVYYDEDCTEPVYRYVGQGFDESEKQAYTVTSGEDGYAMFYGLAEGTYYVKEIEAPEGYVLSDEVLTVELGEDLNESGHVFKDEYANTPEEVPVPTPDTVDVSGSKTWDDDDDADGKRPKSIQINLLANDEVIDTLSVTEADDWAWSFTSLDKYDAEGEEITYTITEDAIADYDTTYDGYDVTNTYTPKETVDVNGSKTWDDNDNAEGKRPESITILLLADGTIVDNATVTEEDGWAWSFTNLAKDDEDGKEIAYSIAEVAVEDYTTTYDGCDVTNKYTSVEPTPDPTPTPDTVDVNGVKTWENDEESTRPDSITIHLYADGKEINSAVVTAEDGWAWSFTDLDKYGEDGKEITYTITEDAVEDYDTTYVGSYDVANTYNPEESNPDTVDIDGSKTWENDEESTRPDSITIHLLADGETYDSVTVTADDNWAWSFTDLPKYQADGTTEVVYTITEDEVENYTSEVSGYDVTNTYVEPEPEPIPEPETVTVSGSKTWDDNNDQDGKRPESITISLLADGTVVDTVTVTEADGWAWSFTGLDKDDADGNEITYSIAEEEVADYTTTYDGYDVINTLTPGKVSVAVTKVWDDEENVNGIRPDRVIIELYKNGEDTGQTLALDEDNYWNGVFSDLDEYTDGVKNVYTIEEQDVEGYTAEITGDAETGFVVTNTLTAEILTGPGPATGGGGSTGGTGGTSGTSGTGGTSGTSGTGTTKTDDAGNAGLWLILVIAAAAVAAGSVTVRTRKKKTQN